MSMMSAKEKLIKLLDNFNESEVAEILEFTEELKRKNGSEKLSELRTIEYWDNDIEDEVWKDV